jgi:hypothetical protein
MTRHEPLPGAVGDPLLPPRRVGRTLAEARTAAGVSPAEAGRAVGGAEDRWDEWTVLEVEAGRRMLDDDELRSLAELYGLELTTVVPERSRLVVDLEEGRLDADGNVRRIPVAASRHEVLERYLALVYAMREVEPGVVVDLRFDDLDVLAGVLDSAPDDLERELRDLMSDAAGPVRGRLGQLAGRLLLPVAGIVVAATAVGTLLLVPVDDSAAATPPERPTASASSVPDGADDVPVDIGTAVVQERADDGTPGPVTERNG